ncbi:TPA: DUF3265 domain-containing protein [Vibrio vulnificus]|nr:DUF3265 domain-containing protein [Vibrio parahaemolyticus]TNC14697.1 DUF3265 domain-containing protein [Vibrio diabolicus]HAS8196677.1 DUF3265 domain-containing protein [Vibrio vulnificus]TNZ66453.1 DUF3265 domain-containing protein [Vibrio parahaemolyticus]TOI17210.1 DUF3265 domain-containing protein [Vibrio parahaemolyticus]
MILSVLKLSNLPIKWTVLLAMNVAFLDQYSVEKATHNKLLKRDSARVAFLVCVSFGVEVPCGYLVIACFTP